MNLDLHIEFQKIDQENMLQHIYNLPVQLHDAYHLSKQHALPNWSGIRQVLAVGMGGSAISADLLSKYLNSRIKIPFLVCRDYELPEWAQGAETLVLINSHSGNTEETLSALQQAIIKKCNIVSITTGGKLADLATESNTPIWTYEYNSQPRAAIGYSFCFMLSIFHRLHLIADYQQELDQTINVLKVSQQKYLPDIPVVNNLAKRIAGQLIDRFVVTIGYGILSPVARRWKTQINELAKSWANFEFLPEADHNTLAGTEYPRELLHRLSAIFLRIPNDQSRNLLRTKLTKHTFMLQGINTIFVDALGVSPLEQIWTTLHLGDYVACYLAIANNIDPTPVSQLDEIKQELLNHK